jgi:hypothetical protein
MQVIPRTQTEQMEYSIAAERRRRMRLIPAEIITDLLSSSTAQLGTVQTGSVGTKAWSFSLHDLTRKVTKYFKCPISLLSRM